VRTSGSLDVKSSNLKVEDSLCRQEADNGFVSWHGIVSAGINRLAAANALDGHLDTLREKVLRLEHAPSVL
jgi:hypothetical protein